MKTASPLAPRLILMQYAGVLAMFPAVLSAQVWHPGLSEAKTDAALSFPLAGVLSVVRVTLGQQVKAGDVLLELENESERLEVERRELAAQAARKDYDRTKTVFDQGRSVSRDELEQKEATAKIAVVEKQLAEAILRRRQLVAPAAGVIIDLFGIDPGEAIAANTPVVRLVDITQCFFTCYVKGDDDHRFVTGGTVEIVFPSAKGEKSVAGTVDFVSPVVDASSGLQQVRAVFDNAQALLPPGLQGNMRVKAR